MPENQLANAAITDMQMSADSSQLDAKYTKELADARLKMMLCVMILLAVVITHALRQSVQATTPPAMDGSPPTGRHRWTGLFHPQREADHYKQLEGNPEAY